MLMTKGKLSAVSAASAKEDYLPPQLLYKGKTPRCHPDIEFLTGLDNGIYGIHTAVGQMNTQ